MAPAFDLPDLAGEHQSLSQWRGQRLLLIFFSPRCGFCRQLAPELATLPVEGAKGQPLPLVITTGAAEENRQLIEAHGIQCPVLLQGQTAVAATYQATGTPMGYLIDEHGAIASELAAGAQALLALAGAAEQQGHRGGLSRDGHKGYTGNRPLSASRINRSGLSVGTPAPPFTLPRLAGGQLSLADYSGQRVLLVFSDPHCGPCDQLSPQLEQLQRHTPEVQVVVISRGEEEENRQKVRQYGLTFPVVLQKKWEISRLYGMFGTPIGYLLDEQGWIAADVAVGVEPILALFSGRGAARNGQDEQAVPQPPAGQSAVNPGDTRQLSTAGRRRGGRHGERV